MQTELNKGKRMKKKIKYVFVGIMILLYVTLIVTELCCTYKSQGGNTLNYLKKFWTWCATLVLT